VKKIITLVSIALAITVNAQQMPTLSILRPQFGVGLKTRFPNQGANYTTYGHFGPYVRKLVERPEIFLATSCFIVPNSLRLDFEFPLNSYFEDRSSGLEGGISAGLSYQFLEKSSLGIHPMIGTSIKRYSFEGEGLMVVPLTIGVNYQRNWLAIELSYQRFFQNEAEQLQLYKSALDVSLSYLFGKKKANENNNTDKGKAWHVGVGFGSLGTYGVFYPYANIGLSYHFNSNVAASFNLQVFDKAGSRSNAPVAAMLNFVKTWNSKGFLKPDLGLVLGYAQLAGAFTGLHYGFVGGVSFVPGKAPRFSFRSGFGVRATPYKYKHYHFNAVDFNFLQVNYRL